MELKKDDIIEIIDNDSNDIAIYQLDGTKLKTLYFSPNICLMSGMSVDEYNSFIMPDAKKIIISSDLPYVEATLYKLLKDRKDVNITYRIFHKTKGFIWVNARAKYIGNYQECPIIRVLFQNTTDLTIGYESLLDESENIIYVVKKGTYEILYANKEAYEKRCNVDLLADLRCHKIFCNLNEPCSWCSIPHIINGECHKEELYAKDLNRWYRVDTKEINWFGHEAFAVYAIDITDQRKKLEITEINRDDLKMIVENIPFGIEVNEINGSSVRKIASNSRINELIGYSVDDKVEIDSVLYANIHKDDKKLVFENMNKLTQGNQEINICFRYYHPVSNKYIWMRLESRSIAQGDKSIVFSCLSDVTKDKENEQRVIHSRQLYESAVETAKLIVWEYDIKSHRVTMMDNDLSRYDYSKFGLSKMIENAPYSLLPSIEEDDHEKFLELYRKIDNGAKSALCEVWYKLKPGQEPRCERITYITVFDDDGKPSIAYGIGQNITTEKLEKAKYDRMYKNLISIMPESLGTFRLNFTKNWCGDGYSVVPRELGEQADGTVDSFFKVIENKIIDPEVKKKFHETYSREKMIQMFKNGGTNSIITFPLYSSVTGEKIWAEGHINMMQNPESGDLEASAYSVDITDKKKEEAIINHITNNRFDYIALIYPDSDECEFTNVGEEMSFVEKHKHYKYKDGILVSVNKFVEESERSDFMQMVSIETIMEALENEQEYVFFFDRVAQDGSKSRKQIQFSFINEYHNLILMIQTDITIAYKKEQEQLLEMKKAKEVAETASQAKSEFLTRISHDIRTPMNVINGMTNFAFEDINDVEKLKQDLSKIKSSNVFLLSLINDILDISKIDSGQMELHPEPYPYSIFIENIKNMFEPLCQSHGIKLIIKEDINGIIISADKIRLNQVVLNLLSNAVKFTPKGGTIIFSSFARRVSGSKAHCGFEVRDTGIGMSEEFQKRMFEPFTQEESELKHPTEELGTGLGLSIVKRIVDFMHGTITVESKLGKGSRFVVEFDLDEYAGNDQDNKKVNNQVDLENIPTGKILIAEDHPINAEIALRMLKEFGLDAERVENGKKAVERFNSSAPGEFKIILMDIQMPVMNGIEATKSIRKLKREDSKSIPIIAMTADAYLEDVNRCIDAGMNDHIAKPINKDIVFATIKKYL